MRYLYGCVGIMMHVIIMLMVVSSAKELYGDCEYDCESQSIAIEEEQQQKPVLHASVVRLRSESKGCALANSPRVYPLR